MAGRKSSKPSGKPSGKRSGTGDDGTALWEKVKASARPAKRDSLTDLMGAAVAKPPDDTEGAASKPQPDPNSGPKSGYGAKRSAPRLAIPALPDPKPIPAAIRRDLSHGCAPGVDKRTAERLKKGRMEIQDRLDLHGMTRESAHRATIAFVAGAQTKGLRCVLIVTGKGKGILQSDLPRWLNLPPLRDRILSFSYARPQDGGAGAVYVLLKRERETRR